LFTFALNYCIEKIKEQHKTETRVYATDIRQYSLDVNNVIIRFSRPMCSGGKINMSDRFSKRWDEREAQSPMGARIKEAVRPPGPLKPRLDFAIRRIELQVQRLDQATDRFTERDN